MLRRQPHDASEGQKAGKPRPPQYPTTNCSTPAKPEPLFTALVSSVNENGSHYFTLQSKISTPRRIIDSGPSRTYTISAEQLRNIQAHRTTFQTTTGATTKTTQAGNLKVRFGNGNFSCRSNACRRSPTTSYRRGSSPSSTHLYQGLSLPIKNGTAVHIRKNPRAPHGPKHLRHRRWRPGRSSRAFHTNTGGKKVRTTRRSTQVRMNTIAERNGRLHTALNHNSAPILARFQKFYTSSTSILEKLPHTHQDTECVPCILRKASCRPIPKTAQRSAESPKERLDAVSTDTPGPISPPATQGNRFFQVLLN